jgi:hypothetical protein
MAGSDAFSDAAHMYIMELDLVSVMSTIARGDPTRLRRLICVVNLGG